VVSVGLLGSPRPYSGLQILRSPAALQAEPDLRPTGRDVGPLDLANWVAALCIAEAVADDTPIPVPHENWMTMVIWLALEFRRRFGRPASAVLFRRSYHAALRFRGTCRCVRGLRNREPNRPVLFCNGNGFSTCPSPLSMFVGSSFRDAIAGYQDARKSLRARPPGRAGGTLTG
jgi:hypothetical protein